MSTVEASNALVSVVRFYSDALAKAELARQQVEATLRKVLAGDPIGEKAERADYIVRCAIAYIDAQHAGDARDRQDAIQELEQGVIAYRNVVGRVVSAPEREGSLRGIDSDDAPDLPDPDR